MQLGCSSVASVASEGSSSAVCQWWWHNVANTEVDRSRGEGKQRKQGDRVISSARACNLPAAKNSTAVVRSKSAGRGGWEREETGRRHAAQENKTEKCECEEVYRIY